jgi:hypothetical protein
VGRGDWSALGFGDGAAVAGDVGATASDGLGLVIDGDWLPASQRVADGDVADRDSAGDTPGDSEPDAGPHATAINPVASVRHLRERRGNHERSVMWT